MISNGCDHSFRWVSFAPMDEIRRRISKRLEEQGRSQSWLSLQLKKNRAYIYQYLNSGLPADLKFEDKLKIADLLQMDKRELGIAETVNVLEPALPAAGFSDDAAPYDASGQPFLVATPHFTYFEMKSRALDQMSSPILPGQILVFDINATDPTKIETGKIVVAQLYDKSDLTRSHGTVIRMFLAPNKLVTNSSQTNEIISLDDPSLPFEPVIKGVMVSKAETFN